MQQGNIIMSTLAQVLADLIGPIETEFSNSLKIQLFDG